MLSLTKSRVPWRDAYLPEQCKSYRLFENVGKCYRQGKWDKSEGNSDDHYFGQNLFRQSKENNA